MAKCGFILVPCPKQCKDDSDEVECFMRKDLDKHLNDGCPNRDYKCQSKCGEKGTYTYITEVHDKTKILPCPNAGCDTKIQRQQVSEHVSKCPHTVVPCKYKGIGCNTELTRDDVAAHEQDDKFHLHMALERVNSQESAINQMQQAMNSLQTTVDVLQGKSMMFVLAEYQKKRETNERFEFPPFYTHGYHMALLVCANGDTLGKGTHIAVRTKILGGEYDAC